jgi:cellulose biosynthesis protein BcsQ
VTMQDQRTSIRGRSEVVTMQDERTSTPHTAVHGLGWPAVSSAPPSGVGPESPRAVRHTGVGWPVSRETHGSPTGTDPEPATAKSESCVSRETRSDELVGSRDEAGGNLAGTPRGRGHLGEGAQSASSRTSGGGVSRETAPTDAAVRQQLVDSIPRPGADTPLAQAIAKEARKRIALTGRRFPKPAQTRVLTVANQKGGVGKTTTTVNIAAALAQSGLKVLVVDLDPQGNASTALGIDHQADVPSIYDVLIEGTPLADVVAECATVPGLFCAPATIDLAGAEIELVSLVARETRLGRAITEHAKASDFDYVLIDCPPSLGLLTVNAFVAASEVFIPIQCEYYALEGLSQLLRNIELIRNHLNPALHVSTILLTMYDGRTRLSSQVAEEVRTHFPEQVLRTTVPRSVRVSEAPSFGETVMTYDPASSGALAYLEAAGEIATRGADGRQG